MPNKLSTSQILNLHQSRKAPKGLSSIYLVLHNIRSKHNVGSAFRSADAFGIQKILLSGFTPSPPDPEINKTALGAENEVHWEYYESFDELLKNYPKKDHLLLGIEQTDCSVSIQELQIGSKPSLVVFGNEVKGIDDDILPYFDEFCEIPQFGTKHSLNVSVSLGITLYALFTKCL